MGTRILGAAAALATVFVLACGGSSTDNGTLPTPTGTGSGGTSGADVTITIIGMNGSQSFSPNPATVKVGQKVAWKNADSIAHTATANAGAFNTGNIAAGATSSPVTMSTAGSFDYHCSIHPTMVGTLTVSQ